jgi:AraC-like DNA-binding protein
LKEHKLSLIDIAAYCGFSSQPHMNFLFKKSFGMTPAEFRKKMQR